MSKLLSALNTPFVWCVYEKTLIVVLLFLAFIVVGLPIQILAVVPPLLMGKPGDRLYAEDDSDGVRPSHQAAVLCKRERGNL